MNELPQGYKREPTCSARKLDNQHIGVRFEQIGDRIRFNMILQRFRSNFLLAKYQEFENKQWWLISMSQQDELADFCDRNGLKLVFDA